MRTPLVITFFGAAVVAVGHIYLMFTGAAGISFVLKRPEPVEGYANCDPVRYGCYPFTDYLLGSLAVTGILLLVALVGYGLYKSLGVVQEDMDKCNHG